MLRVTELSEDACTVELKVEGRVDSDCAPLLQQKCQKWLEKPKKVLLDLSEVRDVDGRGIEILRNVEDGGVQLIRCPSVIRNLLKGANGT